MNAHWFLSLADAQDKIEECCKYYNRATQHPSFYVCDLSMFFKRRDFADRDAIPVTGQPSLFNYVDIDEATRNQIWKSSVNRREQMVSDGLNLTLDLDHWNSINPAEEPIQLPMDFTLDIEIRKAADEDDDGDEEAA